MKLQMLAYHRMRQNAQYFRGWKTFQRVDHGIYDRIKEMLKKLRQSGGFLADSPMWSEHNHKDPKTAWYSA